MLASVIFFLYSILYFILTLILTIHFKTSDFEGGLLQCPKK
jgi:hypothetical protein